MIFYFSWQAPLEAEIKYVGAWVDGRVTDLKREINHNLSTKSVLFTDKTHNLSTKSVLFTDKTVVHVTCGSNGGEEVEQQWETK